MIRGMSLHKDFSSGHVLLSVALLGALMVVALFVLGALGAKDSALPVLGFFLPCATSGFIVGKASKAKRILEATLGVVVVTLVALLLSFLDVQSSWTAGVELPSGALTTSVVRLLVGGSLAAGGAWFGHRIQS